MHINYYKMTMLLFYKPLDHFYGIQWRLCPQLAKSENYLN